MNSTRKLQLYLILNFDWKRTIRKVLKPDQLREPYVGSGPELCVCNVVCKKSITISRPT
jgi:hypothetical protein